MEDELEPLENVALEEHEPFGQLEEGGGGELFLPPRDEEEGPLQLESGSEDDDAEKLVEVETRVRELVEGADLEVLTVRGVMEQLRGVPGVDPKLLEKHRKRIKDYVKHVAEERAGRRALLPPALSSSGGGGGGGGFEVLAGGDEQGDLFEGVEAGREDEEEEQGRRGRRGRNDDDEEEEDFRPVPKRGKKKKKAAQQERKKKREEGGGVQDAMTREAEDAIAAGTVAPAKAQTSVMKAFHEAGQAAKARKKGPVEIKHGEMVEEAQRIVSQMGEALAKDVEANEAGRAGVARATMCVDLAAALHKPHLLPSLIEHGLLSALALWLAPLPDGSPPPSSVKRTTLAGLLDASIDWSDPSQTNALKKSGLGRLVMTMCRTDPVEELRKSAEKLVTLWSRPIFTLHDDYKLLAQVEEHRGARQAPLAAGQKTERALRAAQQLKEIEERIVKSRKRASNRAQLPYFTGVGGAESTGVLLRPASQKQQQTEPDRIQESAVELFRAKGVVGEVEREVGSALKSIGGKTRM